MIDMPNVYVHYFAKDTDTGVQSFTVIADKVTGLVVKSGYKDLQRFIGIHIDEVVRICGEEGYVHTRI